MVKYATRQIDLADSITDIQLDAEQSGIALTIRNGGRPIAFHLEATSPGAALDSHYLKALVAKKAGRELIADTLRREIRLRPIEEEAPSEEPSLTIAICTRHRSKLLKRCLRSIADLSPLPKDFEVVVVDNAPQNDETEHVTRTFDTVRYVREPLAGLDFARNRALAVSQKDYIAYVDDDTRLDPLWWKGLREAIQENPGVGAITGLVLPLVLDSEAQVLFEQRGGFRRGCEKLIYNGSNNPFNELYPCGAGIFGAGANMTLKRDCLLQIGGFDEALDTGAPLPGGGDLDIFYRMIRAGYPLAYEPLYLLYHEHRSDLRGLRRQYYTWGLGFMAFIKKSIAADPVMKDRFRTLVYWWIRYALKNILKDSIVKRSLPLSMSLAEFWGGIVGYCGEYSRSQKRVQKIRAAQGSVSTNP
ncbi:glycosyltransferase [Pelagicoccus sp. SDUM812002]|uniref:glycosyltransferase family 2 protein n=1 Tax=Pelagicoccus sp. SDUM812002 TaxID=3041266 RepID=UPI00280FAF69|nr:glycosyltransferase [Pelagicoccus sp. SDUM812002]